MAWSYDDSNLDTSTAAGRLNAVRFLIGDTDTNNQQVTNEEITFGLSENNDKVYSTSSYVARTLAAKYSTEVNLDLDGQLAAEYGELSKNYLLLADKLEAQAKIISATLGFSAGGITITQIDGNRENTNRVKPSFRRDQFWNPPGYDGDSGYE